MTSFIADFDRKSGVPIYQQLYNYISSAVRSGELSENERLPSKKQLAARLGISANTVEAAYQTLCQEGYLYSKPRSGYYVCALKTLLMPANYSAPLPDEPGERKYRFSFATNKVDVSSFPFRTWARLEKNVLYNGEALLNSGDPCGDAELRKVLCAYLKASRGVECAPSQIVVGAGMEYLLMLLCRLLPRASVFAVEEPGYQRSAAVISGSGAKLRRVRLDKSGISVNELAVSGASVAFVTPSHQFPTGTVMPAARRLELLEWAGSAKERYIIEDDFNSEFSFTGKPIPSLQGLDSRKVIYISTFSRVLAPSIRIAYMVLPPELRAASSALLSAYSSTVSRFDQQTLTRFISAGHLVRHINRVKTLYRRRRDHLSSELLRLTAGSAMRVSGGASGLHLLLNGPEKELALLADKAERADIRLPRLSDYRAEPSDGDDALIFGYCGMTEEEISEALELIFAP